MSRRSGRGRNRNRNRNRGPGAPGGPGGNNRGPGPRQGDQNPRQNNQQKREEPEPAPAPHIPKRYGVVFYETFMQAKADAEALQAKAKDVDQLNIVIKAEGNQWDQDLLKYGKLFAGEAWTLIHNRRLEEGWYNEPR